MLSAPVVILVGGPNTGKTKFYIKYTNSNYYCPTTKSTPNVAFLATPSFVLIDTPGDSYYRNDYEYSWNGIFQYADVILDFGNWSEEEVFGTKQNNPKHMTWSGDNDETMKRLQEYLQEKK